MCREAEVLGRAVRTTRLRYKGGKCSLEWNQVLQTKATASFQNVVKCLLYILHTGIWMHLADRHSICLCSLYDIWYKAADAGIRKRKHKRGSRRRTEKNKRPLTLDMAPNTDQGNHLFKPSLVSQGYLVLPRGILWMRGYP